MDEQQVEPRTIKVLGDGEERNREIERYRDFICFGRKNVDEVCGNCKLRFACFSTRDDIEIPVREFRKRSIKDVTVKMVANKYSALRYKFRKAKNWQDRDRVQIDFEKVVRKDDV